MRIPANRAALGQARQTLAGYRRVQPALDLKHRALLLARAEALGQLRALEAAHGARLERMAADFPMLATWPGQLECRMGATVAGGAGPRVAGVATVTPQGLQLRVPAAGALADPPFLAPLDAALAQALEERIRIAAARETVVRLERAVRTAAQRLNLVEKLLIPELEAEIRRVAILLADRRRAAVVAARIAKRRLAGEAGAANAVGNGP
ncbi:V-type ATP synthase subunit D [Thermaurantiacus sp.]